MDNELEIKLEIALREFGEKEYIIQKSEIAKKIKKNASYMEVQMPENKYGTARAVFGSYGRILKESDDKKEYIFISRAPNALDNEALFITKYDNETLHVGAYAKEGLFFQSIAKKEINKLIEEIDRLNQTR